MNCLLLLIILFCCGNNSCGEMSRRNTSCSRMMRSDENRNERRDGDCGCTERDHHDHSDCGCDGNNTILQNRTSSYSAPPMSRTQYPYLDLEPRTCGCEEKSDSES